MRTVNQVYMVMAQSAIPAAAWQEFIQSLPLGWTSYPGLWSYLQCDGRVISTPEDCSDTV